MPIILKKITIYCLLIKEPLLGARVCKRASARSLYLLSKNLKE
jgi:hypothetical protein